MSQLTLDDLHFSNADEKPVLRLRRAENRCAPQLSLRCSCPRRVGHALFKYSVHVFRTSVRRGATIFDVATDIRTFLILWSDPEAAYWACFLLASMAAPYLVFWSSKYNFQPAVAVLDEFARLKPQTCAESFAKFFYVFLSIPIIGLFFSALLVVYWWVSEVFLGLLCCKGVYRRTREHTERVSSAFVKEKTRTITRLMPTAAMRFFTIAELFYESIPQLGLQVAIYLSGTSSLYTFNDVALSVSASIVNILLNVRELSSVAHSYGMRLKDFLLFFMSASLDQMMKDATPVRLFCISQSLRKCSIQAFTRLYCSDSAIRSICESLSTLDTPFFKELILPLPESRFNDLPLKRIIRLAFFLRAARTHKEFSVTFDRHLFQNREIVHLLPPATVDAFLKTREWRQQMRWCPGCVNRCRRSLSACQMGDMLFGREKVLIEDVVFQESRNIRPLDCDEFAERFIKFLWPLISGCRKESRNIPSRVRRRLSLSRLRRAPTTDQSIDITQLAFVMCLFLNMRSFFTIVKCVRELDKGSDALFELDSCIHEVLEEGYYGFDMPRAEQDTLNLQVWTAVHLPKMYEDEEIEYEFRKIFNLPVDNSSWMARRLRTQSSIEV